MSKEVGAGGRFDIFLDSALGGLGPLIPLDRVPKCDVTKILFLEYFNFGSGFRESILN